MSLENVMQHSLTVKFHAFPVVWRENNGSQRSVRRITDTAHTLGACSRELDLPARGRKEKTATLMNFVTLSQRKERWL